MVDQILQPSISKFMASLMTEMVAGRPVEMTGNVGGQATYVKGLLNKIEREDGSGRCWNFYFSTVRGNVTMFVRFPWWFTP